jgi:hypothetical protein
MSHSRHLVLMDTDRIIEYIFSTKLQKDILGANLLLGKFDHAKMICEFGLKERICLR